LRPLSEPWFRQGRALVVARGSDALLRFCLFLATAHVLDPHNYAVYVLLTATLATSQWAAALGAPRVALYFHAKGFRGALFGWLYGLAGAASVLVIGLAAALPPVRRAIFPEIPLPLLLLGLAPLPFSLLADSVSSTLVADGRHRAYSATLWLRNGATALVLATSPASANPLLWILAGRLVVSAAVAATVALTARARPDWAAARAFAPEAFAYAAPTAASDAVVSLHRRADVFLLSAFGRMREIGPYALAYAFAEAFWVVTDSLEWAFFVDSARRDAAAARESVKRALPVYATAGAGGLVIGYGVGRLALSLFFERRYPGAVGLLPWLLTAAVAWGMARPFTSFFLSQGRVATAVSCQVAGLFLNLLFCAAWIPDYGASGAAVACLASYAAEALLFAAVFLRGRPKVTA
jgi:O-antigen/teichoic acid export membrane protein